MTSSRIKATDFESCLRTCGGCKGVGASNGRDKPTFIHRNPLTNIPEESRGGVLEVIRNALNVQNRPKKEIAFGFETSEDAVTWVVFEYLHRSQLLVPSLQALGIQPDMQTSSQPALLLWGVPVGSSPRSIQIRDRLARECLALGESAQSLSEPDVLIDLGENGIVLIEVKYLSNNDCAPYNYSNWQKYSSQGRLSWDFDQVRHTGCYELARYWCILNRIADGRNMWLVNLGRPQLFQGQQGARLDRFVSALKADATQAFVKATWTELLSPILPATERWFSDFCDTGRSLGIQRQTV